MPTIIYALPITYTRKRENTTIPMTYNKNIKKNDTNED